MIRRNEHTSCSSLPSPADCRPFVICALGPYPILWPAKAMQKPTQENQIALPLPAEFSSDSSWVIRMEAACTVKSTQVKGNISIIWSGL